MTDRPVTDGLVVAVMTAFHPGPRIVDAVRAALAQVDRVVVVDNTPAGAVGADGPLAEVTVEPTRLIVHRPGTNLGLAAGLELGVGLAGDAVVLVLLDQDSALPPGAVRRLCAHLADPTVGVAAPAPWDGVAHRYLDPCAVRRPIVTDMTSVITSGMVLTARVYRRVGGLRPDFFVDLVDVEFCLRVRAAGLRVVQDRSVRLPHLLGRTQWHRLGALSVRATHHPTWRLRWIGRNSGVLLREYGRREPLWALRWTAILVYWTCTVLAFEPPRAVRARALLGGLTAGLRTGGRRSR